jgi:uncharacterized RDD family membrane protein YckC
MNQETNPYAPPASDVSDAHGERDRPIVPASKGRRFGTFVIDYVCFLLLSALAGVLIALVWGDEGLDAIEKLPDVVLGVAILSVYYIFFEGLWARTPGKFVFGTVVVNEQGGRPSIGQIIGRTFCRYIPFEAFSCLGERAWHDSIPKTLVVLAKAD